jgi:hypothetical protein
MFAVAAKDFVDSEFPREHRVKIPGALETAYAAVDALYRNEPLFIGNERTIWQGPRRRLGGGPSDRAPDHVRAAALRL